MLVTTQQLKQLLADYAKVSEAEASSFVDAMVQTIVQHVQQNEPVSIQGLGTFVIVEAQQGQLRRVAFQPEESLKEAVNAPFSFFEPVVISVAAPVEKPAAYQGPAEPNPEPAKLDTEQEMKIDLSSAGIPVESPAEETIAEEIITEDPIAEESSSEELESVVEEPASETENIVSVPVPVADPATSSASPSSPEPEPVSAADSKPAKKHHRIKKLSRFAPRVFFIIMVVAAVLTYLFMEGGEFLWHIQEHGGEDSLMRKSNVSAQLDASLQEDDLAESDTLATAELSLLSVEAKDEPVAADALSPYWIDPATGQPRQVKVKEDETMSKISFETYGSRHFWSYIYELNKDQLGHPNNRVVGKTLYLPNPAYYGIDGTSDASRKKAMYFGYEIYERFNNPNKAQ